jgi:hypothetical protein
MVKLEEITQLITRPRIMDKMGSIFIIGSKEKEYEYMGLIQLRVAPPIIAKSVRLEAGLDRVLGSIKFMNGLVFEGLIMEEKVARIV